MPEYLPTGAQLFFPEQAFNANSLKGAGGVFNSINLNTFHYAGLNPMKLIDPDGSVIRATLNFYFHGTDSKPASAYTNTYYIVEASDKGKGLNAILAGGGNLNGGDVARKYNSGLSGKNPIMHVGDVISEGPNMEASIDPMDNIGHSLLSALDPTQGVFYAGVMDAYNKISNFLSNKSPNDSKYDSTINKSKSKILADFKPLAEKLNMNITGVGHDAEGNVKLQGNINGQGNNDVTITTNKNLRDYE